MIPEIAASPPAETSASATVTQIDLRRKVLHSLRVLRPAARGSSTVHIPTAISGSTIANRLPPS
jgi:hypothetical protein